jgi:hypothetical protein
MADEPVVHASDLSATAGAVAATAAGPVDPLGPVFVSYRQSDGSELAADLAWALRAAGVPVWHDHTDLPPGDTSQRLSEALSSGLSGAILVVTPDIALSDVVKSVELPALLDLAKDPAFTFSIVSTLLRADAKLDFSAPDLLLQTPTGTLSAIEQLPVVTAAQRARVAQTQVRRRLEHLRPAIAERGGLLTLDLQTRVPPHAALFDADLVVRLRPPADGQRRPHRQGLGDLRNFLGQLPQFVAIGGASVVQVRGGAHLSAACAVGAALPTTLMGTVDVIDTLGSSWTTGGQVARSSADPIVARAGQSIGNHDPGPVLAYVDLLPSRSDGAFNDLVASSSFAEAVHLRPVDDGLLEPDTAPQVVGDIVALVRELAGAHATTEVHLLLRCPFPIALLIGRSLNTLTVHLYEWEDDPEPGSPSPRYVPAMVLRSGAGGSPIDAVTAPPNSESEES